MKKNIPPIRAAESLVDLNDLRIFACVAALGSFSSAADVLNIHKSSVSRSIVRLESLLESTLLQRTTRRVALTRRGAELNGHCVDILARVDDAVARVDGVRAESPQGAVRPGPGVLGWAIGAAAR
jgi:DNA-binding transcriptional LysR family regulator